MEKSRIGSAVSRFIDLIVAGLYWLICSLPVITIGAASTALYYAVVKCVRHERGRLTGVFFSAFRREFRQSALTWLIYIGYTAVIALDAYAIGASGHGGGVLGILRWVFFLPALLSLSGMKNGIEWLGFYPLFHAAALWQNQGYNANGESYNAMWIPIFLVCAAFFLAWAIGQALMDDYDMIGVPDEVL